MTPLKTNRPLRLHLIMALFFIVVINAAPVLSKDVKKVAILPFETHSEHDISYIKSGALSMLQSRLAWKDHVMVLKKDQINNILANNTALAETDTVRKIGNHLGADFVLTGSITEFSGAFSLDAKVYNIKDQTYLTFYDQAAQINKIIPKLDIISAKINKKVFNRTTLTYEKMEKDKTISTEDLKRMNPERMMPARGQREDGDNDPWWKIW